MLIYEADFISHPMSVKRIIEVLYTAYGTRYKVEWADGRRSGYLHSRHFKVASYF